MNNVNSQTRRRNQKNFLGQDTTEGAATKNYFDISNGDGLRRVYWKERQKYNSFTVWLSTTVFVTLIYLIVHWHFHSFPSAKSSLASDKTAGPEAEIFYEDYARRHTTTLASFGPRVVGSKANEVHAYTYIKEQVNKMKSEMHPSKHMNIDYQIVSGTFHLENFVNTEFYHVYENVKNIVVALSSKEASDSLLLNCHFDSATSSPGAGDNAVSCAVMLEVLRVLSQSPNPFEHNIIFLFNGAEENILQASHGFITKHPWADSVKAFINLDSAGAGGKEIVFQTGPENPWLVAAYEKVVPHPSANVVGQEIFQMGVIPSDTDYRIFRDFGHIPGLDIAHMANGYIYHTFHDKPKYIPDGCLQRAGENILALTKELATSEKLVDPGSERYGSSVFFDLLGYVFISYSKRTGVILNCVVVAAACIHILKKMYGKDAKAKRTYIGRILGSVLVSLFVWIVAVATTLCIGMLLNGLGRSMFWYTHTYNIYMVYGVAALAVILSVHQIFKRQLYMEEDPWEMEETFFDASLMIWSSITLSLTLAGIGSSYLTMVWVLAPLLVRACIAEYLLPNWRDQAHRYIGVVLASITVPCIICLSAIYCIYTVFIPVMGRAGVDIIPEVPISVLTAFTVIMVTQYYVGCVYVCRDMKHLIISLWSVLIIVTVLVVATPLGFPYGNNPDAPTPQRFLNVHLNKNIYNKEGKLIHEESGIWTAPFDHNSIRYLKDSKFMKETKPTVCDGPYCGMPYLLPVEHILHVKNSYFYKSEKVQISTAEVNVNLTGRQTVKPDVTRLSFNISGPDHMSIYVVPKEGVSLVGWSLDDQTPKPISHSGEMNHTLYFIYYSYGEQPEVPWSCYLDLKSSSAKSQEHILDLIVNGHYIHSGHEITKPLEEYLDSSFPEWVARLPWVATYNLYMY